MYTFKQYLREQAEQVHPCMDKLVLKTLTTPEELKQGLMHVSDLPVNEGRLFVHPREDNLSFWAKNCLIPIDLAYIGSDGVVGEMHELHPGNETPVVSDKPYKYALETNKGWMSENGISIGVKVL